MPPSVSPVAARNAFSAAVSASVASSSSAWRRTVPRMSRHVKGLFELTAPGARRSRRSHEALGLLGDVAPPASAGLDRLHLTAAARRQLGLQRPAEFAHE